MTYVILWSMPGLYFLLYIVNNLEHFINNLSAEAREGLEEYPFLSGFTVGVSFILGGPILACYILLKKLQ